MSVPRILGPDGNPLSNKLRAEAYRATTRNHPAFANWNAPRLSGHAALKYSRETISDRVHDLVRNDGWASSALSRYQDTLVGAGWQLSAMPNQKLLGLNDDNYDEIVEQIECLWEDYSEDPGFWADAERSVSVAGLLGQAVRHQFADGEAIGWIGYREESRGPFSTCLQVIDPLRLSNPYNAPDSETIKDGVEVDEWGAASVYHIRRSHPGDWFTRGANMHEWQAFDRETETGRPIIIHMREKKWAGMSRGEAVMAPVAAKLKQITQYDDFEIQAASLNALLAAFLETPMDAEVLSGAETEDGLTNYTRSEADYYANNPLEFNGVQMTMLHPGQKIGTIKGEHPHSNYESFERNALRNIASAAGMSYEALTADFSQANYSSIRAAFVEFQKGFVARSAMIASTWQNQFYRAWLEEVFDKGLISVPAGVPSFEAFPVAWSHAEWIGPGQGWVDPLKEALGMGERMALGVSTLKKESGSQGSKWRKNIRQISRERKEMIKAGIDPDIVRGPVNLSLSEEKEEQPAAYVPRGASVPSVPRSKRTGS